ncbi:hypothetical protein KS419_17425 [Bacillus tamaricis]|uniref:Uncharacterized protein n=1 Tax=Evansella tamaricis TaxID=2069301 RepID=A0ABS6JL00_9BACI|nr:hypothetical protein [Evansella tamaricis]
MDGSEPDPSNNSESTFHYTESILINEKNVFPIK